MPRMSMTIDIKKARYASFGFVNQEGNISSHQHKMPTVNGSTFMENDYAYPLDHNYPNETRIERARRLDILDRWTPIVIFIFTKYDRVEFRGERAKSLWQAYNAFMFSKQKGKKKC